MRVRWRRRAARAAAFTHRDWRVLAESVGTLLLVGAGLRGRAFARMVTWATEVASPRAVPLSDREIEHLAWLVGVAARGTRFKCLVRALTLSRVLARRGVASSVQIGVRPGDHALKAHAWVEWNGRILNDSVAHVREFEPLDRSLGAAIHG